MNRWVGQVAFVTGASSGIGAGIAEKLVDGGLKVVGFARRKEHLEKLKEKLSSKKGKFYPFPGDATNEADILKAFQWTKENVGPVSILINNAGLVRLANISESPTQLWRDVLDVNVLAVAISQREAIKQMKENNIDGHIININSVAGHKILPIEKFNMYGPSKYAVTALTEVLRLELAGQGSKIKVSSVSPGTVKTEILNAHGLSAAQIESLKQRPILNIEDVADAVAYLISTPQHVNIPELTIQPTGERS